MKKNITQYQYIFKNCHSLFFERQAKRERKREREREAEREEEKESQAGSMPSAQNSIQGWNLPTCEIMT